jgi:uncharacterized protein
VLKASAKDTRGNGTVTATVTLTLTAEGERTSGVVATDLSITGKPAQFGRGMIADVGGKIIEQFSACLSEKLAVAPVVPVAVPASQATAAEPLDLVHYAKRSALKRVGPLAAAAMLVLIFGAWVRRVRSRSRS